MRLASANDKEEIQTNSIKISQKHGVNPTIPICFWCGKEKNEIALLGKLPGDAEIDLAYGRLRALRRM